MDSLVHYLKMTQRELKSDLYRSLDEKKMNPIFEDGFIYAKGDIPVLLVAHMDTVSSKPPVYVFVQKSFDLIYNPSGILGGDDRCGIYAIMMLLEEYKPHVLFTEDEEIGCVGAFKAAKNLAVPDVKYIIEFDRNDKNDCVFYDCGNQAFMDYVEKFGFKTNYGTCSDISVLGCAWNIAAVNLSCGYYNEHTTREYVIFGHLLETIARARNMLNEIVKTPYFDYQEIKYEKPMNLFDIYSKQFCKKLMFERIWRPKK